MGFVKRLLVLMPVLVVIAGCGENAFNGGCNAADTPTVISVFSVTGVRTDNTSKLEVVDGSGDFQLSWDLDSSCTYTYSAYLSANAELGMDDIEISSGTCGFSLDCGYSADINCSFDGAAKTMSCAGAAAVDVSGALPDPSPQLPYIFLTASNEMSDTAVPKSQQVQVEF